MFQKDRNCEFGFRLTLLRNWNQFKEVDVKIDSKCNFDSKLPSPDEYPAKRGSYLELVST